MSNQALKRPKDFLLLTTARLMVLPLHAVALYLLFRGHHLPGGGFIAGLVMGLSVLLLGLASGLDRVESMLKFDPLRGAVVGLLIAATTSVAPMFAGLPLLKHVQGYLQLPYLGKVAWGTPLLFDIGVMLLVAGISIKIIVVLALSMSGASPLREGQEAIYAAIVEEPIECHIHANGGSVSMPEEPETSEDGEIAHGT